MTYALSINRILENIYAFCALDYFTSKQARPEILGRDQAPALRRLICSAAAEMIFRLTPPITATNLTEESDSEIISIELDLDENNGPIEGLRPALESALAASVMALAWCGNSASLSDTYATLFNKNIEAIAQTLRRFSKPGFIEAAI